MRNSRVEDSYRQSYSPWRQEEPPLAHSLGFGLPPTCFNPYATVQVSPNKMSPSNSFQSHSPQSVLKSPFNRINRIDRMITVHKQSQSQHQEVSPPANPHPLRTQFKIKCRKTHKEKEREDSFWKFKNQQLVAAVHVRNFTLDQLGERSEAEEPSMSTSNCFQENFKNRCRLHQQNAKVPHETSLLNQLNKISKRSPLNRYKSKVFVASTKITSFFP